RERRLAVADRRRGLHFVPVAHEQPRERVAKRGLVVDDENGTLHLRSIGGRSTSARAPPSERLRMLILPRCSSTMLRETASPRPVPRDLVEKKGVKRRASTSGVIPVPESSTVMRTPPGAAGSSVP